MFGDKTGADEEVESGIRREVSGSSDDADRMSEATTLQPSVVDDSTSAVNVKKNE